MSLLILRVDKGLNMESEEISFMAEEGSSGFAQKRPRMMAQTTMGCAAVAAVAHPDPSASPFGGPWLQPPPPWMQPSQMAYNNPWVMGGASQSMLGGHLGSMSYGNPWMLMPPGIEAGPRHDSVAQASRRHKRKEYDVATASRTTSGHKPNTL
jgi:hypothetical protein